MQPGTAVAGIIMVPCGVLLHLMLDKTEVSARALPYPSFTLAPLVQCRSSAWLTAHAPAKLYPSPTRAVSL